MNNNELKANLSIHGTPSGHNFDGEAAEAKYCESFYNSNGETDVDKMIIEVVDTPQGYTCHYTYQVSKDVSDVIGRRGGYIALTLSINQLCTKSRIIYEMLQSVFDTSVLGTFITPVTPGYQHLVGHYSDSPEALDAMRQNCFGLLRSLNKGNEPVMMPINSSTHKGTVRINPYDVTDEDLLKAVQTYKRVEVSAEFPCIGETDKIQIEVIKAQKEEATKYEKKISDLNKQIEQLKSSKNTPLKPHYGSGDNEKEVKTDFENQQQNVHSQENDNEVQPPSDTNFRNPLMCIGAINNRKKLLLCIGGVVLIVVILCFIFSGGKQVSRTILELELIENKIDRILEILQKPVQIVDVPDQNEQFPYKDVRIDLADRSKLKKGQSNILTIQKGAKLYDCSKYKIELSIDEKSLGDGADIKETKNSNPMNPEWDLYIPPEFLQTKVTIFCSVNGKKEQVLQGGERYIQK